MFKTPILFITTNFIKEDNSMANLEKAKSYNKMFRSFLKTSIDQNLHHFSSDVDFICSNDLGKKLKNLGITDHIDVRREELEQIYNVL